MFGSLAADESRHVPDGFLKRINIQNNEVFPWAKEGEVGGGPPEGVGASGDHRAAPPSNIHRVSPEQLYIVRRTQ